MNNIRMCFGVLLLPLFLSDAFFKKTNTADAIGRNMTCIDLVGNNTLSVYDVRLTFTGYTTFYGGPPDCPIRPNGKVVLNGLLSGTENVDSDDDITYTGILQLKIDMDICSAKRLPNGEDKLCTMTVTGSGPVKTELELYYNGSGQDSARGGYINISYDSTLGKFEKLVIGDCDVHQVAEEQKMVPNKTIASIFNGVELPMLKSRTLRVGTYVETGSSGKLEVQVLRKVR